MTITIEELRQEANKWVRRQARGESALMGHADGTVKVSGYSNRVHIRVKQGGKYFPQTAINVDAPNIWGKAIRVARTDSGVYMILGIDAEGDLETDTYQPVSSVGPHGHGAHSGNFDPVEANRIMVGLVSINTADDLTVKIWPFYYPYQGTRQYWGGGTIDLTSYVPGTTGHWAWVKVGINPATNTAVATAGTSKSIYVVLAESELPDIAFAGYIQLAAIRLRNGQTEIDDIDDFFIAREMVWAEPPYPAFDTILVYGGDVLTYEGDVLYYY